jgi:hypothetical protein
MRRLDSGLLFGVALAQCAVALLLFAYLLSKPPRIGDGSGTCMRWELVLLESGDDMVPVELCVGRGPAFEEVAP